MLHVMLIDWLLDWSTIDKLIDWLIDKVQIVSHHEIPKPEDKAQTKWKFRMCSTV